MALDKNLWKQVFQDASYYAVFEELPTQITTYDLRIQSAVDEIQRITAYGDEKILRAWVTQGEIEKPNGKVLSVSNLKKLLDVWAGCCPMLQSAADVAYLLRYGRKKYLIWLQSPEFRDWCCLKGLPDQLLSPYWADLPRRIAMLAQRSEPRRMALSQLPPLPYPLIERSDLVAALCERQMPFALAHRQPIVIHGGEGAGKSALMNIFAREIEGYSLVWVSGNEHDGIAIWLQNLRIELLYDQHPLPEMPTSTAVSLLKRALGGQQCCLLLDNCQALEIFDVLGAILPPGSLAVLTTRTKSGLQKRVHPSARMQLNAMPEVDSLRYYLEHCQYEPGEDELRALTELAKDVDRHRWYLRLILWLYKLRGWPLA